MTTGTIPGEEVGIARRLLLALAALAMAGTSVELALERHWDDFVKLIPWFALGVLAVALALVAYRPAARRIAIARVLCVLVIAASAIGVFKHIEENHKAGPLDYRYSDDGKTKTKGEDAEFIGINNVSAPANISSRGTAVVQAVFLIPDDAEPAAIWFHHGFASGGVKYELR